jgi:raffinose/stachyose/melibiose transport system permease protein
VTASVSYRVATGRLGAVSRSVLFLPQVIPLVAAGIIWGRLLSLSGLINQALTAIGLGDITRAWLGDFDTALPAVGLIGIWVLLGFCTVLLLTGMSKIDSALYESARLDGAGWFQEFRAITVPSLRYEIGVCVTVTIIAALARSTSSMSRPAAARETRRPSRVSRSTSSPSSSGRSAWPRSSPWSWSSSSSWSSSRSSA